MDRQIPIVIPAFEPDERMLDLLNDLCREGNTSVIIVDDGSDPAYEPLFEKAQKMLGERGIVLRHERNRGKGRALKTAFAYVLESYPEAIGCVTVDSDGQHTLDCIHAVSTEFRKHPRNLVLGTRNFDTDGVPWKSRFGNKLTTRVFAFLTGCRVSDTQTGLRGIPRDFMRELLDVKGERFEFETQMLLESAKKYPVVEVPIQTIYDSQENHQTHFDPFLDSIRIYRILGKRFFLYLFASLSSSVVDLCAFALFCHLLKPTGAWFYVALSTVFARLISGTYNFALNYKKVFQSEESVAKSAGKYALLALAQMTCSALFVTALSYVLPFLPEVLIKTVVDTVLFLISYKVQQKYVFH